MDWIASEAPGVSSSFEQLHFPNPGGDAGAGLSSRQGLDSRSGIPRSLEIAARNEGLHEVGEPARSKERGGHLVFSSPASARAPSRPRPVSPEAEPSRQVFSSPASARTQPRPRPVSLEAEGGRRVSTSPASARAPLPPRPVSPEAEGGRRVFTSPASEHAELPAAGSEIWGGERKRRPCSIMPLPARCRKAGLRRPEFSFKARATHKQGSGLEQALRRLKSLKHHRVPREVLESKALKSSPSDTIPLMA